MAPNRKQNDAESRIETALKIGEMCICSPTEKINARGLIEGGRTRIQIIEVDGVAMVT